MNTANLRVMVADGPESFLLSNGKYQIYQNMGLGAVWNWRHCSQEIIPVKLWAGGISAVMCLPVLKAMDITRVVQIRCRRSRRLRTQFPGISYTEHVVDDMDKDSQELSRLIAVRDIVNAISENHDRVFAYETVLREDSWIVVTMAASILQVTAIQDAARLLTLARAFKCMCHADPQVLSDIFARRRRIGSLSRALMLILRHRPLPQDVVHTIAAQLDSYFAHPATAALLQPNFFTRHPRSAT
jgi:hypothetical protein